MHPLGLTLYLLVSSAGNLGKLFGSRSGATKCLVSSGSKLFDTLMVFLKYFFKKVDFEKKMNRRKNACKIILNRLSFVIFTLLYSQCFQ